MRSDERVGLVDARLEPWGLFGPGWVNEPFYAHVIEPQPWLTVYD